MAVAATNCPTRATEVWNSCARPTRSGPNISTETSVRKTAAESRMSSTVGEAARGGGNEEETQLMVVEFVALFIPLIPAFPRRGGRSIGSLRKYVSGTLALVGESGNGLPSQRMANCPASLAGYLSRLPGA